ncbi:hypothetical protein [Clostridium sp. UBA1056]|uniref:hypothetical protein n=1 Tax=unclassified Clostridium TaxID=2614128 RepID=UPI0032174DC4
MKKKTILKSLAISGVLSVFLTISAYAAGGENYSISWNFNSTLTGQTRSFSGNSIKLTGTSSSQSTGNFNVTLYRNGAFSDTKISTNVLPKNGTSTVSWGNVGSGKYYLYMAHSPYDFYINGTGVFTSY